MSKQRWVILITFLDRDPVFDQNECTKCGDTQGQGHIDMGTHKEKDRTGSDLHIET